MIAVPSGRPRLSRLRHVGLWMLVGLLGAAAVVLAATKVVHATWNHEKAGASISGWASKSMAGRGGPTGQGFTFQRVDYAWWPAVRSLFFGHPLHFDSWGVDVWDPLGGEVIHAAHVSGLLRLDRLVWAQVWGALPFTAQVVRLEFFDVLIDSIRCRVGMIPHDQVNIVAAFASTAPRTPEEADRGDGLVIVVHGTTVTQGAYRMAFPTWEGDLERFQLQLDQLRFSSLAAEDEEDRPAFTYRVKALQAPAGHVTIAGQALPLDHFVAHVFRAEDPRRQDMVVQVDTQVLGADVKADGRLTDLYGQQRGVDLQLSARHLRAVLAALPSSKVLAGDVAATAHIVGRFDKVVLQGAAHGADLAQAGLEAHQVAARYRLADGRLALTHIDAAFAGGHVRGEVAVALRKPGWSADLELEQLHLLQLGKLLPLEVLAYFDGVARRIVHPGPRTEDETEHLHLKGVDAALYRRPHDSLPHRVVLRATK